MARNQERRRLHLYKGLRRRESTRALRRRFRNGEIEHSKKQEPPKATPKNGWGARILRCIVIAVFEWLLDTLIKRMTDLFLECVSDVLESIGYLVEFIIDSFW